MGRPIYVLAYVQDQTINHVISGVWLQNLGMIIFTVCEVGWKGWYAGWLHLQTWKTGLKFSFYLNHRVLWRDEWYPTCDCTSSRAVRVLKGCIHHTHTTNMVNTRLQRIGMAGLMGTGVTGRKYILSYIHIYISIYTYIYIHIYIYRGLPWRWASSAPRCEGGEIPDISRTGRGALASRPRATHRGSHRLHAYSNERREICDMEDEGREMWDVRRGIGSHD